MFGIAILGFAVMQKIVQNNKNQIWDQKLPYLGILGSKFEKVLLYFQHPRICQTAKCFLTNAVNFGIGSSFFKGPGSTFS